MRAFKKGTGQVAELEASVSRPCPCLRGAAALAVLVPLNLPGGVMAQDAQEPTELETIRLLSAEEQLKQSLGVSTISAEDLERTPVVNDISEILRKMPGANLTGTSASGQRGNQRQIDLRGMGPENTLILIDGKPVLSRNSVRMGRAGERDSRGDSNWVPAEAIERIEVIRGPAAARYGSGAAGGVVNIITKKPEKLSGTVSASVNVPQHSEEGMSYRTNVMVGGPVTDVLSFRLYGSYNKTEADDADINESASSETFAPAGREGVVNNDFRGVLTFQPLASAHAFDLEAAYSRQGNIYAGDSQLSPNNGNSGRLQRLIGEETNSLERRTIALTHRGDFDLATSNSYIQWENTRNRRLLEELSGGVEGSISEDAPFGTITLDTISAKSEWTIPFDLLLEQDLTAGMEYRGEWMNDPVSNQQDIVGNGSIAGIASDGAERSAFSSSWLAGVYLEDNILVTDELKIVPGIRLDYHETFGVNPSPSLNAFYEVSPGVTLKGGIARVFKAPNLFQSNPNYVMYSRGNGCPGGRSSGACYVIGNEDLEAETSINKEAGISYDSGSGWSAAATYFHNDYRDRIAAGLDAVGMAASNTPVYRWENVPEAVVSGLEGSISVPLHEKLTWRTNATYMLESKNKQNGQPLSLVPDYTVNTWLDWAFDESYTLSLSATHYGETPAPTVRATTGVALTGTEPRAPYTLVNAGITYDSKETFRISGGVTNIFDKRVYRLGHGNNAGANTFNEAGRTFYLTLSASF